MANKTGLYRVSQSTYSYNTSKGKKKKMRWKYKAKNELLNVTLTSNNLLKLKIKVLEANLDWGIIDLKKAEKSAKIGRCDIKDLQGQYGIQL